MQSQTSISTQFPGNFSLFSVYSNRCSSMFFFSFLSFSRDWNSEAGQKTIEHTKETVKQSRVVGLSVIEVVSKSKISFWRRVASYFGQWPKNCVYCVRKFLFILFVCWVCHCISCILIVQILHNKDSLFVCLNRRLS